MVEIIHEAQLIQVGEYRLVPSELEIFYSLEKMKNSYSEFFGESILIEYDERGKKNAKKELKKNEKEE